MNFRLIGIAAIAVREGINAWRDTRDPEWTLSPRTDLPDLPWPEDPTFDGAAQEVTW